MFGDDECFRVSGPKLVHAWTFSKNLFDESECLKTNGREEDVTRKVNTTTHKTE